jgi:hypothetical protein
VWITGNGVQVRRWSDGGRGAFVDFPSATNSMMQILSAVRVP